VSRDQQEAAIASGDAEQQSVRRQIVTQITPASAFYRAEEYQQRYLEKHGRTSRAATSGKGPCGRPRPARKALAGHRSPPIPAVPTPWPAELAGFGAPIHPGPGAVS